MIKKEVVAKDGFRVAYYVSSKNNYLNNSLKNNIDNNNNNNKINNNDDNKININKINRINNNNKINNKIKKNKNQIKENLMLFSAWPYDHTEWTSNIKDFEKEYNVITIDYRGYGESDKSKKISDYNINKIIKDIKSIILAENISKVHIIGHCSGGMIALDFYKKCPTYVKSIVLLGMPISKALLRMDNVLRYWPVRAMYKLLMRVISIFQTDKKYNFSDYDGIKKYTVRRVKRFLGTMRHTKFFVTLNYLKYIGQFNGERILRNAKVPIMYVVGERDDLSRYFIKDLPKYKKLNKVVVKGGNHFLFENNKKMLMKKIIEFIKKNK